MSISLKVFPDSEGLIDSFASYLVSAIHAVVDQEGICSLLLSGGSTPIPLYEKMTQDLRDDIPWNRLHLFWADERFVPRTDDQSNYGNAAKIFGNLDLTRAQVHPIPVCYSTPNECAIAYEQELRLWSIDDMPHFEIALLGIGTDGHTASLFPGNDCLDEKNRLVVATESPSPPTDRISVTLPVLNASGEVHFLAAGANKGRALQKVFADENIPAALVRPNSNQVTYWVDAEAAEDLPADYD